MREDKDKIAGIELTIGLSFTSKQNGKSFEDITFELHDELISKCEELGFEYVISNSRMMTKEELG